MTKISIPGVYYKDKSLTNGQVRRYYYHRATGPRLPDDPRSPEFFQRLNDLNGGTVGVAPAPETIKHLIAEYKVSRKYTNRAANTKKEYDRHLAEIERFFAKFLLRKFTRLHLEKYLQKFAKNPTKAEAMKRMFSILASYAVDPLGWITVNPFFRMSGSKERSRADEGQKPYEEYEIAQFRERNPLGTRARLAFEIALGTALRREDLTKVRAPAMLTKSFGFVAGKNKELIVLPVTAMMREAYLALAAARAAAVLPPSAFALCSERGTKLHKRTVSADMEAAFEAAGFEEGQRLHALRYTAAMRLLKAGFP